MAGTEPCTAARPRHRLARAGSVALAIGLLAALACNTQEGRRAQAEPTDQASEQGPAQGRAERAGTTKTILLPIEGMSCGACAARVKRTLTAIDGVEEVEVNLGERNARIRFAEGKLSPERLASEVNELGYRAGAPTEAP